MKTSPLLKALPFLALIQFATAQQPPSPAPADAPPAATVDIRAVPTAPVALTINFPGGPLDDAVGAIQEALLHANAEPVNVVISISKDQPVRVPALVLRNVTGPDALTLIATAAGAELRPIVNPTENRIIGWEFARPLRAGAAGEGGGPAVTWTSPQPAPAPFINTAPVSAPQPTFVAPQAFVAPPGAVTFTAPAGTPSSATVVGGSGNNGVAMLSSIPGVGRVFTATAAEPPRLEGATDSAGGGGLAVEVAPTFPAPAPDNTRQTRVYALGTLVWYANYPDIAKTLQDVIEADGLKTSDVKISFHEKTSVLVANGTPRAHQLIGQLIEALSRDAAARQAENQGAESKKLRDEMDRQAMSLRDAEDKIQLLRKTADEAVAEAARLRAEADIKASQNKPKPVQQ